nr:phosphoenolpyruvate mutase [Helicobacter anatolicus]
MERHYRRNLKKSKEKGAIVQKIVYVAMAADLLHAGHINVLQHAKQYGKVIVGLFSDHAIAMMEDAPLLDFEERKKVIENLSIVDSVVVQDAPSYKENLYRLKPDYVVHGDDWKKGYLKIYRDEVIEILYDLYPQEKKDLEYHPRLIEVPYSTHINALGIKRTINALGISKAMQQKRLRVLLGLKKPLRFLETHSALSALIAENTCVDKEGRKVGFDGFWSSSLTDSTNRGKPDIEAVELSMRLNTLNEIFEVTHKPLIYDADTGGLLEHFVFSVRTLERVGVSAVVIEDKTGLKKNSLLGNEVHQVQEDIEIFCQKIRAGKKAQVTQDFMIIARIESLILDKGQDDALKRAFAYIEAGADGIMIHSRHKDGVEIIEFLKAFRKKDKNTPIVVVPTSFNAISAEDLAKYGVNIVIYANHMLRSAFIAMQSVAKSILENDRSLEAEKECMSIKEILSLIPGTI